MDKIYMGDKSQEEEEEEEGAGDITWGGVTDWDGQHDIIQKTSCVFSASVAYLIPHFVASVPFRALCFHSAKNGQSSRPSHKTTAPPTGGCVLKNSMGAGGGGWG